MIAYFDTSALVPLVIDEPSTAIATSAWNAADRVVSVGLAIVESRAALAQARRIGRLDARQLRRATATLTDVLAQVDLLAIDDPLLVEAAEAAEQLSLRAYDAVHLAGAARVADATTVLVAGDRALLAAAQRTGLAIVDIGPVGA